MLDNLNQPRGSTAGILEPNRAPAVITRSVADLLLDGEAGLRKNFGAKGDGVSDDTAAFNDWWACLMDVNYKRRPAEEDESTVRFMLQKGPLLKLEHGTFVYSGKGLDIATSNAFVFNVVGESALSTKVLITGGYYLFDFANNPVHSLLGDMTIHGGLGAVRYRSKSRNASGMHIFKDLRVSRYSECAISHNSVDMPYFRVERGMFYGRTDMQTIGVCVSGLAAGGYIKDCVFSDNRYGIKLAVGDNGIERTGPATPFLIEGNDFYRTGNRAPKASYDVWVEPGSTAQNSGRSIKFSRNKFGQEFLVYPDCHILVADAYPTGSGAGLNGDRHHTEEQSSGFFSGARFDDNDVNSVNSGYSAPYIKSFTPNIGNLRIADSYDNGMPSRFIEFSGGILQSQVNNLTRTNVLDISHCVSLQKGVEPSLLSNLNDVIKVVDPLQLLAGHPQSTAIPTGNQHVDFTSVYAGPTSSIAVTGASRTAINNSYGGITEAAEITLSSPDGRAVITAPGGVAGRQHWIDFEVRRGSTNPVRSVIVEILDQSGVSLQLRRVILMDSALRWQKVVLPYVPNESGNIVIRFRSGTFVEGTATTFAVGNANIYQNPTPINTGHNSGLSMRWSTQHEVRGSRHVWVDSLGNFRSKNGQPTSESDGVIISANPSP